MNEKIKELAKKSGFNTDAMYPGGFPNDNTLALHYFAELIIKECISIPYAMWDKAELNADVAVKIEHRIKEHFEVGE